MVEYVFLWSNTFFYGNDDPLQSSQGAWHPAELHHPLSASQNRLGNVLERIREFPRKNSRSFRKFSRSFSSKTAFKVFRNDSFHRCDWFRQIFVQIGAILAIFRPFEIFGRFLAWTYSNVFERIRTYSKVFKRIRTYLNIFDQKRKTKQEQAWTENKARTENQRSRAFGAETLKNGYERGWRTRVDLNKEWTRKKRGLEQNVDSNKSVESNKAYAKKRISNV